MRGSYRDVSMKLTIASSWKNAFNRRWSCDLSELYAGVNVQPHQIDATLIGIYGLEQGLGVVIDYDVNDIFNQVVATSLIGTRK